MTRICKPDSLLMAYQCALDQSNAMIRKKERSQPKLQPQISRPPVQKQFFRPQYQPGAFQSNFRPRFNNFYLKAPNPNANVKQEPHSNQNIRNPNYQSKFHTRPNSIPHYQEIDNHELVAPNHPENAHPESYSENEYFHANSTGELDPQFPQADPTAIDDLNFHWDDSYRSQT